MINPIKNIIGLLVVHFFASGFVLITPFEPRISLNDEGVVQFKWDGTAPEIKEKDDYRDGILDGLDDKEAFRIILSEAARRWESVPGAKLKIEVLEDAVERTDNDLVHSVVVRHDPNLSAAAFALPRTGGQVEGTEKNNKLIVDCDISIGESFESARMLAETVTHEIGHCLGLGHSHTNYKSIMGYSRNSGFELGADDMAGIVYLYPNDETQNKTRELVAACGVVGGEGAKTQGLSIALVVAIGLIPPLITISGGRRKVKG